MENMENGQYDMTRTILANSQCWQKNTETWVNDNFVYSKMLDSMWTWNMVDSWHECESLLDDS